MGFKETSIGVILAGLFAIALLTFGIQLGIENDALQNIINEEGISKFNSTLQNNLESVKGIADDQKDVFEEGSSDFVQGIEIIKSLPQIIISFFSMMFNTFNILTDLISRVIGIPALVINVVFGAMIITMIILGWRVIKAGGT